MGTVANIYDNGPISPVARVKENIAVWQGETGYVPYKIEWMEPIPASSTFRVDLCVVGNNNTPLAAGPAGQIAATLLNVLTMNEKELFHLRWYPLDDVEGAVWQLSGSARFSTRGGQARVTLFTRAYDPYLATTTFYVIGQNKDARIGAFNPLAVAQPMCRFQFFGFRYVLTGPLSLPKIADGSTTGGFAGPITYLPAQSR